MTSVLALQNAYLLSDDPIVQSGFSGGRERWVAERKPLVDAFVADGSFLDVGCAVGLLAEDVVAWAGEKGLTVEPFGIDIGDKLIEIARSRHAHHAENFFTADAWSFTPSRRWTYVYSLLDLAPDSLIGVWLNRLASWVAPGGRLIIGSYGSRSREIPAQDAAGALAEAGFKLVGSSSGGNPTITRFGWADVE